MKKLIKLFHMTDQINNGQDEILSMWDKQVREWNPDYKGELYYLTNPFNSSDPIYKGVTFILAEDCEEIIVRER